MNCKQSLDDNLVEYKGAQCDFCTGHKLDTNKRYFELDLNLARYFVFYDECLSNPPPFLYSQIIQSSPTIRKKGWNFSQL